MKAIIERMPASSSPPMNTRKPEETIPITGDDQASRFARVNDLIIVKWIRSETGLGIRESRQIAKALRQAQFDCSDDILDQVLTKQDIASTEDTKVKIRAGLQKALSEIEEKSPWQLEQV